MSLFSVLENYTNKNGVLNLDAIESDISNGIINILNDLSLLDYKDLNAFFKILLDGKRYALIFKFLSEKNFEDLDFNTVLLYTAIKKQVTSTKLANLDVKKLTQKATNKEILSLYPVRSELPQDLLKRLEKGLLAAKNQAQTFKQDLKDQIVFLETQKLFEKANEIRESLSFHFPDKEHTSIHTVQSLQNSKENTLTKNYAKVIERNLSFESRSQKRTPQNEKSFKKFQDDRDAILKMATEWSKDLNKENLDLLLTQLEFLDFNEESFYSELLKNETIEKWNKVTLYIKSKNFLEGLNYLEQNESALLTDGADSIYNFYYSKAVLLLGAGMSSQAEEILQIIADQKESYRDVKLLLKS